MVASNTEKAVAERLVIRASVLIGKSLGDLLPKRIIPDARAFYRQDQPELQSFSFLF